MMVAIHNKNGQGLLPWKRNNDDNKKMKVAIHNKNGQGLLPEYRQMMKVEAGYSRNPQ